MKNYSTILFRLSIIILGLGVIALCISLTGLVISAWGSKSSNSNLATIFFIGMYSCVIPFFIGLYHTMKILGYIDSNRAFSELSVKSLIQIKYCAIIICIVCTIGGLPFFYYWTNVEDAPGLMIIGMIIAGTPFIFALFVSIIQKLLTDAINIKKELDSRV